MKKISVVIVFLLVLIVFNVELIKAGWRDFRVESRHDDFDGYTVYRMINNYLDGKELPFIEGEPGIDLGGRIIIRKDGTTTYTLVCSYTNTTWMFIAPGESLVMLIDGERVGFSGNGSIGNREVGSRRVFETASYAITLSDLKRIANAKEIRVKLLGEKFFIEQKFTQINFNNFTTFLTDYVK